MVSPRRLEAESIGMVARTAYPSSSLVLCRNGVEALDLARRSPVFLCLVQMNLPDMDGGDLCEDLVEGGLARRIMILFGRMTEIACYFLQRRVVDGFFDSSLELPQNLEGAIRRVGEGSGYASCSLREAHRRACAGRLPLERILSNTEMLVFAAIGDGSDDRLAAELLGMSIHTVHTHRTNIMRKLELKTKTDLIQEAAFRGIVRQGPEGVVRPGFTRGVAQRVQRQKAGSVN